MAKVRNHRKRLTKIARRRGVEVKHVSNWSELAERLAQHHGLVSPVSGTAKRFCYEVMECLGWIPRRVEVVS